MILTISTTHEPATDLGYLLHKHPDRLQTFELSFGKAHVFYPVAEPRRCAASLLLDVDPVKIVRGVGRHSAAFSLGQYVNDRPYAATSFLSVAIAQVFGTALAGRCKDRPALVNQPLPLEASLEVLPVRGAPTLLERLFEPLGYEVAWTNHPLDSHFPEWGSSPYYSVTLRSRVRLAELLTHLYVLIPVFDNHKHYFVGEAELEKLLAKGAGWLETHPEKREISQRYLKHRAGLARQALEQLTREESAEDAETGDRATEDVLEQPLSLNAQRIETVCRELRARGARRIIDLGCGEGKLLGRLREFPEISQLVGVDVSLRALERAAGRLRVELPPLSSAARGEPLTATRKPAQEPSPATACHLLHGSLIYRDRRFGGFDAATLLEVIEHLDPPRLTALERVVFEFARPRWVIVTTPNREYNVMWDTLPAGEMRHPDHRFEWTREEFAAWSAAVAQRHGYTARMGAIGPLHETHGAPTQLAVFALAESSSEAETL